MGIEVNDKDIVVPGELLATGMDYVPAQGTYRIGEEIRSKKLGLVTVDGRAIKLIPLSGRYLPKRGDTIIGRVEDIAMSGWRLSINSPYSAMLSMKDATSEFIARGADLTRYYELEDYIVAKIINVTSQKLVDVTMKGPGLRKLSAGRIIEVNTNKVPRIIGKQGSMVSMVKTRTNTNIIVGQNGLVWIKGNDPKSELLAIETIRLIEKEAHLPGLTDRIAKHLGGGAAPEVRAEENMAGEDDGLQ
ncbi:RNA-binding protein [Candidatus Woesearchaeota archaeon CG11_big_fil_rev_8_21_14_0_20_43_8]|nr:MAG: RNA-binding protein [Candidatus Woesearchaeota archaeon CG11_big_fil_rev_8_21_14_0_20_43_8]PIO05713.1 MAG: RNA-binding protein [Candidatus Woesearchaeota archaeon CG08_land_8_20_14_0_20_43_7]